MSDQPLGEPPVDPTVPAVEATVPHVAPTVRPAEAIQPPADLEPEATTAEPDDACVRKAPPSRAPRPVVPERAWEDDPRAWGDRVDSDDDHYLRDVPPHWS